MSMIVPKDWNVTVGFPDGTTGQINLFQMRMMVIAVRFRAEHGMWTPDVAKLRLTKKKVCDMFYINPAYAKTYEQLAETLDECCESMMDELRAARGL